MMFPVLFLLSFERFNHPELHWKIFESERALVYYHQGLEDMAKRAAFVVDSFSEELAELFGTEKIKEKIPIILKDTEVAPGGYTSPVEGKIVVNVAPPFREEAGGKDWLQTVIQHEMTHFVTLEALYGSIAGGLTRTAGEVFLPMWMMEGLAQRYGEGWDTLRDMFMRVDVLHGKIMSLQELDSFYFFNGLGILRGYYQSQSFISYIFDKYGDEKLKILMRYYNRMSSKGYRAGFKAAFGKSVEELYREWISWLVIHYVEQAKNKEAVESFATKETILGDNNLHPAFSPQGGWFSYVSNAYHDYSTYDLYIENPAKRIPPKKILSRVNPVYSWDPEGRRIAFSKYVVAKWGRIVPRLFIYDLKRRRCKPVSKKILGFQPAWSPKGDFIAFSFYRNGYTSLALIKPNGKDFQILFEKPFSQNYSPAWSPDASRIAFVHISEGKKDILVYDFTEKEVFKITDDKADDRDPFWLDNDTLLFSSDRNGIFNIYMYSFKDQSFFRLTNLIGGAFEPFVHNRRLYFVAYTYQGYQIYSCPFEKLQKEPVEVESSPGEGIAFGNGSVSTYYPVPKVLYVVGALAVDSAGGIAGWGGFEATDFLHKHYIGAFYLSGLGLEGEDMYQFYYMNRMLYPTIYLNIFNYFNFAGFYSDNFFWTKPSGLEFAMYFPIGIWSDLLIGYRKGRFRLYVSKFIFSNLKTVQDYSTAEIYIGFSNWKLEQSVDMDVNPTGGHIVYCLIAFSHPCVGSYIDYYRALVDLHLYFRFLPTKNTFALHSVAGFTSRPLPWDPYFLGGTGDLRGFDCLEVSGQHMILNSLEYRHLVGEFAERTLLGLYLDRIYGALFIDSGTAWNYGENLWDNLRLSIGADLRFRMLIKGISSVVFTVGVAKPLLPDRRAGFYFQFGIPY